MSRTMSNDPLLKYKFRVTIPGLPTAIGFNKVSGLKRDINTVEYNEGGYAHTHKLQGREKVDPVTLEKGMFAGSLDLYNMYKNSLSNTDTRVTVTIELMDKLGTPQATWKLAEA
jgi:phage tail-like protein